MAHFARAMVGSLEGGATSAASYMGPEAVRELERNFQEVKSTEAYSATLQAAQAFRGPGSLAATMGQARAAQDVADAHKYAAELDYTGRLVLPERLGGMKAAREIKSILQAMAEGGVSGAQVIGDIIGTKALGQAMADHKLFDKIKKAKRCISYWLFDVFQQKHQSRYAAFSTPQTLHSIITPPAPGMTRIVRLLQIPHLYSVNSLDKITRCVYRNTQSLVGGR